MRAPSGWSLATVTRPVSSSTSTERTPSSADTSSRTDATQCSQVMPSTSQALVVGVLTTSPAG